MNHKFVTLLFALFVLIHDPHGDRVVSYEGMSRETVSGLVTETGFAFDFIDAQTYATFLFTHQPVPLTASQILAFVHSEASASAISGVDSNSTLGRGAALVTMDELNILRQRDVDRSADVAASTSLADLKSRWAARSALPQRAGSQIKTAIQNKINAGDAD